MSRNEFVAHISKDISYDGYGAGLYLDHRGMLAEVILEKLGFTKFIQASLRDKVADSLEDICVYGDVREDAVRVTEWCEENLGAKWVEKKNQ